MSISIDNIVNVNIGVASKPLGLAGSGNLLFLTDEVASGANSVDATERVTTFTSLAEVQGKFPAGAYPEVTAAATAYYGQEPSPLTFMVGAVLPSAFAGWSKGTGGLNLATLQAFTDANLTVEVDSVAEVLTGLNFEGATSLTGVADILQVALHAAAAGTTCEYDAGFKITSPTTGASSTVDTYSSSTDGLLAALGFESTVDVVGATAETPAHAAAECKIFDQDFNTLVADKKWRDNASAITISDWCQASNVIFGNTTNDAAALVLSTAGATVAGQIADKGNGLTISSYGGVVAEYPSASVLGRINTTNYQGTKTALTLMFKKLPTITVNNLNTQQLKALRSINCNALLKVAGTASMYSDGRMADGSWLDTKHGLMWLENQIQLNVFNLFYASPTKIPYTESGVALAIQQVDLALKQAVRNGLVAAGNDSNGNYIPAGYEIYHVPVSETSSADKGNRIYNGITFVAVGAGALHGATITGNFNE